MTERIPEQNDGREGLIEELQLVSAALGAPDAVAAADAEIPVLLDIVELPPAVRATDAGFAPAAMPQGDALAALEIEAGSVLDDLMDEFLPLIEARLRDRLEEKMQQLLAAGPAGATAD